MNDKNTVISYAFCKIQSSFPIHQMLKIKIWNCRITESTQLLSIDSRSRKLVLFSPLSFVLFSISNSVFFVISCVCIRNRLYLIEGKIMKPTALFICINEALAQSRSIFIQIHHHTNDETYIELVFNLWHLFG